MAVSPINSYNLGFFLFLINYLIISVLILIQCLGWFIVLSPFFFFFFFFSAFPFMFDFLKLFVVQPLSSIWLFATLWTAARQAFLSITNSQSLLKLTSIESVMPSSHLILCRPLLLLQSFPASGSFPVSWLFASGDQILALQHQSFRWIFRTDLLWDWLFWSPCSPQDS